MRIAEETITPQSELHVPADLFQGPALNGQVRTFSVVFVKERRSRKTEVCDKPEPNPIPCGIDRPSKCLSKSTILRAPVVSP